MKRLMSAISVAFLSGAGPAIAQNSIPHRAPPPPFAQPAPSLSNGCGRNSGIFLRPVPGTHLAAPFPPGAIENHEVGRVLLSVIVDGQGSVREVTVTRSSGYPDLDDAAMAAVKDNWRWQPPPPECAEMGVVVPAFYNWSLPVSAP
jgi:protein TonB